MKRTMCVWLPNWPIQRVRNEDRDRRPLVLYTTAARGILTVTACSRRAAQEGVRLGMPLAEAESLWANSIRAPLPSPLGTPRGEGVRGNERRLSPRFLKHDPRADRTQLRKLAKHCYRYTPVVALEEADAPAALFLDVTGSAHLFGGERSLAERV